MRNYNKWIIALLVLALVLGGGGWLILQRQSSRSVGNDQPTETAVVQRGNLSMTVDGSGSLIPRVEIRLAFTVGGRVAEVLVQEGDSKQAGNMLARLEPDELEARVAEAELALITARQALSDLDHNAAVITAQAELDLANARKALDDAMRHRSWQSTGNRASSETIAGVEGQLTLAEEAVSKAEGAVDRVSNLSPDDPKRAAAEVALYDARHARDVIKANLNWYTGSPTDFDQAILDAQVTVAQANVDKAQADFDRVMIGPDPDDVAQAQAQVKAAEAALQAAQSTLDNATLTAPISGVVTALFVEPGEMANAGQTVVVLSDLSNLEVEVNVDETDVTRIAMGMPVVVTADAFPGVELSGQVIKIAPTANVQSGVVLYPVTVRLDPTDMSLRSGMTVNVTFTLEERKDTLIVPFRAVETEGGQAYVTRVTASGNERVPVTLGLITDTLIEILDGLSEGDAILVYANPVQDSSLQMESPFGGGQ